MEKFYSQFVKPYQLKLKNINELSCNLLVEDFNRIWPIDAEDFEHSGRMSLTSQIIDAYMHLLNKTAKQDSRVFSARAALGDIIFTRNNRRWPSNIERTLENLLKSETDYGSPLRQLKDIDIFIIPV